MADAEKMDFLIRRHLSSRNFLDNSSWKVKNSELNDRGLFATRDIAEGELIATDFPVVMGPRCSDSTIPMCVNCYKTECTLFPCDKGCGLPVCSNACENSEGHRAECEILRKWEPKGGSMWLNELLLSVVPVRGLCLSEDDKELISELKGHEGKIHGREIDLLKKNVNAKIDPQDEEFMRKLCLAMDTNAMETIVLADDKKTVSLRALYPIGCIQNHSCSPNTRHFFREGNLVNIYATMPIKEGEELTMTYVDLLWDTMLRRQYLLMSKHFECMCKRCCDVSEFGSNAGAMFCANMDCFGMMFPEKPLDFNSTWFCQECGQKLHARQRKAILSGFESIIRQVLYEPPRKILRFVRREMPTLVPNDNYMMLEMKFRIISYFGRTGGVSFQEMGDKELALKAEYCQDLLEIIDKLRLGECQKKGFILFELYCTKREELSRKKDKLDVAEVQKLKEELKEIFQKARLILKDDVAAPEDLSTLD